MISPVLLLIAQQPPPDPQIATGGGMLGIFASGAVGVITLMGWFVKRQVESTDKAVEALRRAVESLSKANTSQRRYLRAIREDIKESRRMKAEEHAQIMAKLGEVRELIVRADQVIVNKVDS